MIDEEAMAEVHQQERARRDTLIAGLLALRDRLRSQLAEVDEELASLGHEG
jgi:hypothetical protein